MSLSFFVPGDPVPQGRARSFKLGDSIGHYDDPKSNAWKKVVAQVAGLQRDRFQEGPLEARVNFFLPAPKSMPHPERYHHAKRPDLDNLCKAIFDALNGICYKDDSQICKLITEKVYAHGQMMSTGVHITIGPIS